MKTFVQLSILTILLFSIFSNVCKSIAATPDEKPSDKAMELCNAAEEGDLERIKTLLATGVDVNAKDFEGVTALHNAVIGNRKDIAEILITKGADVNVEYNEDSFIQDVISSTASTPLQIAAWKGYREMVELLIKSGVDIDKKAKNGNTALHYAAFAGHKAVVELLLANHADPNLEDKNGRTILELAVQRSHEEIAKMLVSKDTKVTIHLAAFIGNLEKLKDIINNGTSANAKDKNGLAPLHYAAMGGNRNIAEFLIEKGANIDQKTSSDPCDILPRIYEDFTGNTSLFIAAAEGYPDVVELLASKGADVNTKGSPMSGSSPYWAFGASAFPPESALLWAVNRGHIKAAEVLLNHGAHIHARGLGGSTPLHMAAQTGNVDAAKLLLSKGANINRKDESGNTPLHEAIAWGHHKEVVKILIDNGADINAQNNEGWTPLHEATTSGHPRDLIIPFKNDIAEILLDKGVKINLQNNEGNTPLHHAALYGDSDLVNLLLAKGADIEVKNLRGEKSIDLAKRYKRKKNLELLRKYGAKE